MGRPPGLLVAFSSTSPSSSHHHSGRQHLEVSLDSLEDTTMGGELRSRTCSSRTEIDTEAVLSVTFSQVWARLFSSKEVKLLILGLDAAGKVRTVC